MARVLPLAFLHVIFRFREGGDDLAGLAADRIPSAVVEVQVGVDDDIDVFGRNAGGGRLSSNLAGCP